MVAPPYNASISFEMSILEENPVSNSLSIDESIVSKQEEELVHSPSQVLYSFGTVPHPQDPHVLDDLRSDEGNEEEIVEENVRI